jgi:peptidoglycan hydrolase-like protein with peptidoglycan-binding domain
MKKYISIAFALFIFFPLFASASITQNLQYGSKGSQVTELQTFLISKGFLSGQPTGTFFGLTKTALKSYQSSVGLPTTGNTGVLTRSKINAVDVTTSQSAQKSTTPTSKQQNFTLPNGTVVDSNGNIITAAPKQTQVQQTTQIIQKTIPAPSPVDIVSVPATPAPVVVPPPAPIIPFVATVEIGPGSPLGTLDSQTAIQKSVPLTVFNIRENSRNYNAYNATQTYKGGLYWENITFTVQSNDFSNSDITTYCGVPNGGNTFKNYNNQSQCSTYGEIYFALKNPHPGKLNIIVNSVSYLGSSDGIEYTVSNTPIDSGEITIQ